MWTIAQQENDESVPPRIPDRERFIGSCHTEWWECEPGIAFISTTGGTVDDRQFAEALLRTELATVGIRQAAFTVDPTEDFRKTADWNEIQNKAMRLIQSGNVTLHRNGYNNIVATVVGDHGTYQSEISRDDPSSRTITQWTCDCPWDQYAFQRTRQWKKYEARPCAHVLATYWKGLSTPLDEDVDPTKQQIGPGQAMPGGRGQGDPMEQGPMGIGSPNVVFNPDGTMSPRTPPGQEMMPGMGQPQLPTQPLVPGMQGVAPGMNPQQMQMQYAQPAQNPLIPPFPGAPPEPMPTSVPGGTPGPYPANPMQQGGTLSRVIHVGKAGDTFLPDTSARVEEDTMGQSEGREGATDAGQWMNVPKGTNVVVVYQDPNTGWVECLMPLKGGRMTSYHVRFFIEPEKLTPLPNRQYTPFQNPK